MYIYICIYKLQRWDETYRNVGVIDIDIYIGYEHRYMHVRIINKNWAAFK
jgi:hypothetical protein